MKTQITAKDIKITEKTFLINELYKRGTQEIVGFERVVSTRNSQAGGTSNYFNAEGEKVQRYELPEYREERVYFRGEWL